MPLENSPKTMVSVAQPRAISPSPDPGFETPVRRVPILSQVKSATPIQESILSPLPATVMSPDILTKNRWALTEIVHYDFNELLSLRNFNEDFSVKRKKMIRDRLRLFLSFETCQIYNEHLDAELGPQIYQQTLINRFNELRFHSTIELLAIIRSLAKAKLKHVSINIQNVVENTINEICESYRTATRDHMKGISEDELQSLTEDMRAFLSPKVEELAEELSQYTSEEELKHYSKLATEASDVSHERLTELQTPIAERDDKRNTARKKLKQHSRERKPILVSESLQEVLIDRVDKNGNNLLTKALLLDDEELIGDVISYAEFLDKVEAGSLQNKLNLVQHALMHVDVQRPLLQYLAKSGDLFNKEFIEKVRKEPGLDYEEDSPLLFGHIFDKQQRLHNAVLIGLIKQADADTLARLIQYPDAVPVAWLVQHANVRALAAFTRQADRGGLEALSKRAEVANLAKLIQHADVVALPTLIKSASASALVELIEQADTDVLARLIRYSDTFLWSSLENKLQRRYPLSDDSNASDFPDVIWQAIQHRAQQCEAERQKLDHLRMSYFTNVLEYLVKMYPKEPKHYQEKLKVVTKIIQNSVSTDNLSKVKEDVEAAMANTDIRQKRSSFCSFREAKTARLLGNVESTLSKAKAVKNVSLVIGADQPKSGSSILTKLKHITTFTEEKISYQQRWLLIRQVFKNTLAYLETRKLGKEEQAGRSKKTIMDQLIEAFVIGKKSAQKVLAELSEKNSLTYRQLSQKVGWFKPKTIKLLKQDLANSADLSCLLSPSISAR